MNQISQVWHDRAAWLGLVLGVLLSWPAMSHHSFAMYDHRKVLTITGTVETWFWANPHCSMTIDLKDKDGKVERWILSGQAVSSLERIGMHGSDIKVGDKITVEFHPALNGGNTGYFQSVTVASGRRFSDPSAIPADQQRDVLANPLEPPH